MAKKSLSKTQHSQTREVQNRRARHDFEILETLECGMVLRGSEVKSIRDGKAQLSDSYAQVIDGELFWVGGHIDQYEKSHRFDGHSPDRKRKLLAHKREIQKLTGRLAKDNLTLVPLRIYFHEGRAKIEIALAKGKRRWDKRQSIAERDSKREQLRQLGRTVKGNYGDRAP